MSRLAIVLAASLAVASVARADAIASPSTTCPAGSVGTTSHAGQWCTPAACTPSSDCDATMHNWATPGPTETGRFVCGTQGVCVRTTRIQAGGDTPREEMITKTEALATCRTAADCPPDAPCDLTPHCVPNPSFVSATSPASSAFWRRAFYCDESPGPPSHVGGLFLGLGGLGLATVLIRRRRR